MIFAPGCLFLFPFQQIFQRGFFISVRGWGKRVQVKQGRGEGVASSPVLHNKRGLFPDSVLARFLLKSPCGPGRVRFSTRVRGR